MGFFKKHKAARHRVETVKSTIITIKYDIDNLLHSKVPKDQVGSSSESEELLIEWAEWRELQARLEGDNEGDEQ